MSIYTCTYIDYLSQVLLTPPGSQMHVYTYTYIRRIYDVKRWKPCIRNPPKKKRSSKLFQFSVYFGFLVPSIQEEFTISRNEIVWLLTTETIISFSLIFNFFFYKFFNDYRSYMFSAPSHGFANEQIKVLLLAFLEHRLIELREIYLFIFQQKTILSVIGNQQSPNLQVKEGNKK